MQNTFQNQKQSAQRKPKVPDYCPQSGMLHFNTGTRNYFYIQYINYITRIYDSNGNLETSRMYSMLLLNVGFYTFFVFMFQKIKIKKSDKVYIIYFFQGSQHSAHTLSRLVCPRYEARVVTNIPGRFVVPGSIPINTQNENNGKCQWNNKWPH